jgi:hypothetical protein
MFCRGWYQHSQRHQWSEQSSDQKRLSEEPIYIQKIGWSIVGTPTQSRLSTACQFARGAVGLRSSRNKRVGGSRVRAAKTSDCPSGSNSSYAPLSFPKVFLSFCWFVVEILLCDPKSRGFVISGYLSLQFLRDPSVSFELHLADPEIATTVFPCTRYFLFLKTGKITLHDDCKEWSSIFIFSHARIMRFVHLPRLSLDTSHFHVPSCVSIDMCGVDIE